MYLSECLGLMNLFFFSEFEIEVDKDRSEWSIGPDYPRKHQARLTNEDGRDVMFSHKKPGGQCSLNGIYV